jgi:hypothetical protein
LPLARCAREIKREEVSKNSLRQGNAAGKKSAAKKYWPEKKNSGQHCEVELKVN